MRDLFDWFNSMMGDYEEEVTEELTLYIGSSQGFVWWGIVAPVYFGDLHSEGVK